MGQMFENCSSLTTLDLSGFDTGRVTNMFAMFSDCNSLTTLNLSGFDTGSVDNMGGMFNGCSSLTTLDVSDLDTGSVTSMAWMFENCSSLTTLDLSGFDTGSLLDTMDMFYGCSSLTALNLSGFDTSGVNRMNEMFSSCSSLKTLDLSSFSTANAYEMYDMFDACTSLSTVILGSGFSFKGSGSEVLATLPPECEWTSGATGEKYTAQEIAENRSGIADTYTAFKGIASGLWGTCPWEIDEDGVLTIHAGTGEDTGYGSRPPWYAYGKEITAVSVREPVVFPEDSTVLFNGLGLCVAMDLSGADTSHVKSFKSMFNNCYSLETLDISSFDTANATDLGWMFWACGKLTELDVSRFRTSQAQEMRSMFFGCSSLRALDLSGFDTLNGCYIDGMFGQCSGLELVTIGRRFSFKGIFTDVQCTLPDKTWYAKSTNAVCTSKKIAEERNCVADSYALTPWPNVPQYAAHGLWGSCLWTLDNDGTLIIREGTGTDTGSSAYPGWYRYRTSVKALRLQGEVIFPARCSMLFQGMENCTSMDLSTANTSGTTSFFGMFQNCNSLTALNVSAFDTSAATDLQFMFSGCWRLKELDLRGFDTAKVITMYMMFAGCDGLTRLNLSSFTTPQVQDLSYLFYDCRSLVSLDLGGFSTAKVSLMGMMFKDCDSLSTITLGPYFSFIGRAGADGSFGLPLLPEKTWFAKSDNQAYTAEELAAHHGGDAETYGTAPFVDQPAAVTGLQGRPVDTNASRLTWNSASGASGYQLWRSDNGGAWKWIKNCTTTVVNNYSLTPGMTYAYRVRAYKELYGVKVYGGYSDEVRVHILDKIGNFTVTGKDTNCAFLKWDAVAGCTGYQVFRTVAGSGEYTWVKNAKTAQVANYSLKPDTTYYYKIRAYIDLPDGRRAYGQYSDGIRVYIQPQVTVTLKGGTKQITITWTKADGATGYQIFYTEAGTGGEYKWWKNIPAGTLTATLKNLKANTDYWFKVRSYVDLPDGSRYYGQLSEAKHVWTNK